MWMKRIQDYLWLILPILKMVWTDSRTACRDRDGVLATTPTFHYLTCANCYSYIIRDPGKRLAYRGMLVYYNTTAQVFDSAILADVTNTESVKTICDSLGSQECNNWKACCHNAVTCCSRQKRLAESSEEDITCPITWDGYACWDATLPGTTVSQACPAFIDHSSGSVSKTCTNNGTWSRQRDVIGGQLREYTDYTVCIDTSLDEITVYVSIGSSAFSILALIPAVTLFLRYRHLRAQHRIQIHLNMFGSLVLSCLSYILWDTLVSRNRWNTANNQSAIAKNTVWCRLILMLTRYSNSCTFSWMFMEAFYLHRLIVRAFKLPKTIMLYFLTGWGVPLVFVIVYSIIRLYVENRQCWIENINGFEWIVYGPNCAYLLMNILFLCNILRILLTKLRSDREPRTFRRAVKATCILVPLFGLQAVFIIYRFDNAAYRIASKTIVNLQGLFMALIFCYCNKEVISSIKRTLKKRKDSRVTQDTHLSPRPSVVSSATGSRKPSTASERRTSVAERRESYAEVARRQSIAFRRISRTDLEETRKRSTSDRRHSSVSSNVSITRKTSGGANNNVDEEEKKQLTPVSECDDSISDQESLHKVGQSKLEEKLVEDKLTSLGVLDEEEGNADITQNSPLL